MTVLVITARERADIRAAVDRARAHPVPISEVMRVAAATDQTTDKVTLAEREATPKAERMPQEVMLPMGYRVAFSFEQQPIGMCLHVSMSSMRPDRIPRMDALAMVLDAAGIVPPNGPAAARAWIEEFEIDGQPGGHAINLVVCLEPHPGGLLQ